MTEAEWRASDNPDRLFDYLTSRSGLYASRRKLQLYACGCSRQVWPLRIDARSRKALVKLEGYADRLVGDGHRRPDPEVERHRRDAYNIANAAYRDLQRADAADQDAACCVVCAAYTVAPANMSGNLYAALRRLQGVSPATVRGLEAGLIRDIFGNPFRPVAVEPAWRTEAVVALARGIYAERAFDRLPVLADALDDAGCDNADLLAHCRDPALTHVRGCWAVDLLLDRS